MRAAAHDPDIARTLRSRVEWLRQRAAESDANCLRWTLDSVADELEQIADRMERRGGM